MKGGPTIQLVQPEYVFIMKYNHSLNQIYIQVPSDVDPDGWETVYRSGETFKPGRWSGALRQLSQHNPCVPHREEGFK